MQHNTNIYRLFLMFFVSVITIQTKAQIITDRPDQTESSSTVGRGNLQLECGFLIGYSGEGLKSVKQLLIPSNLFRYGITNAIEFRLLNQLEVIDLDYYNKSFSGVSDIEVGTKIQILRKENMNTEIAFLSHLVLPTGSENLTLAKEASINKLSISHALSEDLGLGYNLGYNYFSEGNGDFTYSIALNIGVNENVGIYVEPYGEVIEFTDHIANFDAGFTYLLNENFQLDFSFGSGINERSNYLSTGFSWLMNGNKNN